LLTNPHQPSAALIDYLRRDEKDFVFHVVEVVVIEIEASFQRTIGYPSLAFEEVDDLGKNCIEGHSRPSAVWTSSLCEPLR
jgi:hypothetical protein